MGCWVHYCRTSTQGENMQDKRSLTCDLFLVVFQCDVLKHVELLGF